MAWKFFNNAGAAKVVPTSGAGYGISLPASPSDSQEFVLVDSLTLPPTSGGSVTTLVRPTRTSGSSSADLL